MKHNLKTIREKLERHCEIQDMVSFAELKGEFDGLAKELRQLKQKAKDLPENHIVHIYLNEILGDSEVGEG